MNVILVPHTHVDQFWPTVGPMLARALTQDDGIVREVTPDQLRMMVVEKRQHLIVILEGASIIGALTIEFVNYPNKRVALGTAFGGRGIATQAVMDEVKQWCKDMGASEFKTFAKDAQARLYRRLGMKKLYNVVGVTL